jgi:hypothetical protein
MLRAKENLKIEVTQSTAGEIRTYQITVNAPAQDFLLPDLLSQRGALESFEWTLKQSVRCATENYLARTEELIAGIAGGQKQELPAAKQSLKSIGKGPNSYVKKRADAPGEELVKPQISEPVGIISAAVSKGD